MSTLAQQLKYRAQAHVNAQRRRYEAAILTHVLTNCDTDGPVYDPAYGDWIAAEGKTPVTLEETPLWTP